MTNMCAAINDSVFLHFINTLNAQCILVGGDIPVPLFVVSLMTFTGAVCVLVVFLKHSCAYYHFVSTVLL